MENVKDETLKRFSKNDLKKLKSLTNWARLFAEDWKEKIAREKVK